MSKKFKNNGKSIPQTHSKSASVPAERKLLDSLIFINKEQSNKELITHYFFEQFIQSPDFFYGFLDYVKNELLTPSGRFKKEIASKYLEIVSNLAERFSFFKEKTVLDDLSFKILHPKHYEAIDQLLSAYKKKSKKVIKNISAILKNLLESKNYSFTIEGRYKNIYSIHKKIQKKHRKNILNLNDIFAFRIILNNPSIKNCFNVLNLLHDNFTPIPRYFKDYISIPKINGYQSLHTGLTEIISQLDLPIEIQIRTTAMHEFAEKGLAAHWIYKKEKKSKLATEKEVKIMDYFSSLSHNTQQNQGVYCFSYKGNMVKLEKGATILDFAYKIHTEMGHKAKLGLVYGEEKPLNYVIQEGDRIEIVKSDDYQVNQEWLTYTHHPNTSKKILNFLKYYEQEATKS